MQPLIIAYYTINTPYEIEILNLKKSLEKLQLPYDIRAVDNLGSWEANTHYKAKFIKQMMQVHSGIALLYVDADAVFNSAPVFLYSLDSDIAVRFQDFNWRKNECLSGTIFLRPTVNTHKLVDTWIEINKNIGGKKGANADEFEQANLARAIEMHSELKVVNLPPEYTFIYDHMKRIYPDIQPVIEHFQASRRCKKMIGLMR